MTQPPKNGADVRDMLVVHESFREEYARMPGLVLGVAQGDTARAKVVADHVELIETFLHLHHKGEDELLWPKLAERAPAALAGTLALMDEQHVALDRRLRETSALLATWRQDADRTTGSELADRLTSLGGLLTEHLAVEEKEILSIVDQYVTDKEWHQLGDHAINGLPKARLPVIFGMLASRAEPEVVKLMLSTAPLVPRLIMPALGPRAYASHVKRVYGAG
ncbi:hemerythrin domain-containing protein [Streptomyces sp. GC420]|uniref:hemerythrin domain-containing protein n=1 Tax=Streptomyces sp. GC420 TaxID=2697568 RepID=UPI00141504ED|nr:hemerythrin domain-containing protein [Streptomyces sp. GC420]NBM18494.1 hemerythrin domain-containing protein [Streptomyces sp. GC420]